MKKWLLGIAQEVGGSVAGEYAKWYDTLWLLVPIAGIAICYCQMWEREMEARIKRREERYK